MQSPVKSRDFDSPSGGFMALTSIEIQTLTAVDANPNPEFEFRNCWFRRLALDWLEWSLIVVRGDWCLTHGKQYAIQVPTYTPSYQRQT